ncbi:hypothetical protein AVEN_185856-1 [Araneus ventricosus]|uniref:Threonyl/alanyl tRNA synthetase SAD domain-containing protein n=1 Tax=Araneus ventricosus TaxID=182803 RepID=A0A4Y2JJ36_ARAVE|nr:hypothetical protein AVEN_185856-1 [Araneus ventricosus]
MYTDPVREVSIGISLGDLHADTSGSGEMVMSPEFCGKIHLKGSSLFGHFIIFSEEATAKEKRRIVALIDSLATKTIRISELIQGEMKNNLMDFKKKIEDIDSSKKCCYCSKHDRRSKNIIGKNLSNFVFQRREYRKDT